MLPISLRLFIPVILLTSSAFGRIMGGGKEGTRASQNVVSTRLLQINRILMSINDRGSLTDTNGTAGAKRIDPLKWDQTQSIVFDQGPWIIGKVNDKPAAGIAYWGTSYMPGPIIDGRPGLSVRPQDASRYHPYAISTHSSSSDPDVLNWPADLGAPLDTSGKPRILGNELVWSVFNAADSTAYPQTGLYARGGFQRIPIEIQQSIYAAEGGSADTALLSNTAFIEWTFINKGTAVIESCYTALWTDIDFDNVEYNFPGIDTAAQLGYCWDGLSTPEIFPYAVGYVLLYGPSVSDPSSNAIFRGHKRPQYRNLPPASFWGILFDADGGNRSSFLAGPQTIDEAWNIARGFDRMGGVIIDSVTQAPTRFPYSGDPVNRSGWFYNLPYGKNSAGFLMFCGPFTFAPGDTQWMMTALIPALGRDRFESIQILRQDANRLRSMSYDSIVAPRPAVLPTPPDYPSSPSLFQNYPNPFNPSTTIRYGLPGMSHVTLSVYNPLGQRVAILRDENQDAGYHEVRFDGSGLASGVYFYRLQAGNFVKTMKLLLFR